MIRISTLLVFSFFFLLLGESTAQNFRVQIAAYLEPMPETYFREKGVNNCIASHDEMGMHRYFAGSCNTRDEAEKLQKEMVGKGFPFATVIDLEEQEALSDVNCPYDRPGLASKKNAKGGTIERNIYFDFGSQALLQESKSELDAVCQKMKENPSYKLNLFGHTDAVGNAQANIELATNRARVARDYLINKGIRADRMFIKVFGEAAPAAANAEEDNDGKKGEDLPENRKLNRRVELILTDDSEVVKTGNGMGGR